MALSGLEAKLKKINKLIPRKQLNKLQMKKLHIALVLAIFLFTACSSTEKKHAADKEDYIKAQETVEAKEKKNPATFLSVHSKDKHNLVGQTVIKGTIANKAKICVYYDVVVELSFKSKTGALLEKESETIYETIEAGKSVNFKTKYFAPKGTDSVLIKVMGAKTK